MSNSSSFKWNGTSLVLDAAWGDNGKGKIVDYLSPQADLVIRWAGGPNAGHTVNNEHGEFKFHLIPSGIFNTKCILADTVVVDLDILIHEIDELLSRGIPVSSKNLLISPDITMILDWHKKRDALIEVARGEKPIGTTRRGIGPAYADRTERIGLQIHHLFEKNFEKRFKKEFDWQTRLTKLMSGGVEKKPYDYDDILRRLKFARKRLEPMIQEVLPVIWKAHKEGKRILGEGAQGALLDIDLGTAPYVTSSHPTRAGFSAATGVYKINHVYAASRAYTARVGSGPFPTELKDEIGDHLVEVGHEYGTTTGRRRRCGWFDAVATYYGAHIAGATEIAITKLDVLDGLDEVKICVGYIFEGKKYGIGKIPTIKNRFLDHVTPIYKTMNGWSGSTKEARSFKNLPKNAQKYILMLQKLLDKKIRFVSVGPKRDEMFSM